MNTQPVIPTQGQGTVDVPRYLSDLHAQQRRQEEQRRRPLIPHRRDAVDSTYAMEVLRYQQYHTQPILASRRGAVDLSASTHTANALPSDHWHLGSGMESLPVPQGVPDPDASAKSIVAFKCVIGGQGMAMTELLHHNARGLVRPDEKVLDKRLRSINFRIQWPGYDVYHKEIPAFREGKPITRAELGFDVSMAFAEFIYHINSNRIPPREGAESWMISGLSGTIALGNLRLINVRKVGGKDWQADVVAVKQAGHRREWAPPAICLDE
ncbi:hypothetical protein BV22DRAFT_1126613 [Leucogyrophana mollusca]|uniref:Uncharacterized protein n=1 Tax=Leucogyrophana mollusca TaxID=85980 RepID=A0ACB8BU02_9AGAM|nr:hypothetical protein BV22DRAFT_1126613 [Leucogyrophana mollusca]